MPVALSVSESPTSSLPVMLPTGMPLDRLPGIDKAAEGRVRALQHTRRMCGGAQAHLMRCDDDNFYVVKFQNNPQHTRILANDWLATQVGRLIGLPMPKVSVVEVDACMTEHTPGLRMEICGQKVQFTPGLSFGSQYVISPLQGQVYDYLPESMLTNVRNLRDFAGVLAFDKWTCNADGRQAAFWKKGRERKFQASFIDQGYCFNAAEWNFPDAPLRGVFGRNEVYAAVTGWESFQPWLQRIEQFPEQTLWELGKNIPAEWYDADRIGLEKLLLQLIDRRSRVRELILSFKNCSRNPFPNWKEKASRTIVNSPAMQLGSAVHQIQALG